MKLIVTRIGVEKEKINRNTLSVRLRTKVLTVLVGTALTIAVCLMAERLPGRSVQVSVDVQQEEGFLLPAVCYEDIDASLLAEDLTLLAGMGYEPVTCSQVIRMARGLSDPPEKPILIVFGGSDREIFTEYLPLLEEHGMPANVVIFGSDADLYSNSIPKTDEARLSWNEIRSMEQSGLIETISGSYAMHSREESGNRKGISRLWREGAADYQKELSGDLLTMQTRMNEELSHDASVYFYPFGEESDESEAVLRELGFLMTLTEGDDVGRIDGTDDLFDIEYLRRGKDPSAEFFERIGREPA